MNFMEVVEQMKRGKKIALSTWCNGGYLYIMEREIMLDKVNSNHITNVYSLEATDWEVVEEPKKTLWDKVCEYEEDDKLFSVKDVKEALKEFIKHIGIVADAEGTDIIYVLQKAKEIFGEEMLK